MNTRTALVLVAVMTAGCTTAFAQRERRPLDGYGFVSSYYDNNVFSYSDQDRDLYNSGLAAVGRFPIESLADVVTTLALRGDYRWDIEGRSMWRARLLYDGTLYASNTDRNYNHFGVSLDRIMRRSELSLAAHYTPDYYLRTLYWRPMPQRPAGVRYAPAVYDRFMVSASGSRSVSSTVDLSATIGYTKRNYDFPFDERDNDTYVLGAGVNIEITPRFALSLNPAVEISAASGADSTNPAVADISNNRYGIEAGATWRMAARWSFVQSIDYGHQVYTTDNPADLSHYDRRDDEITLTSALRMMPANGWQPEFFFQYRASTSTTPPGIAEFGEYRAFRAGLQVTYYF